MDLHDTDIAAAGVPAATAAPGAAFPSVDVLLAVHSALLGIASAHDDRLDLAVQAGGGAPLTARRVS